MGNIYQRWNIHHRLQHILLFVSFFILTFTGLPIKYAYSGWAVRATSIFGGFDTMLLIHKVAAVIMIISAIYHLGYLLYCWLVKKQISTATLPTWKDVTDLRSYSLLFWIYERGSKFDRYSYKRNSTTGRYSGVLPSWWDRTDDVFPTSRPNLYHVGYGLCQVAHSDEAMLAIMAVLSGTSTMLTSARWYFP